MSNRSTIIWVIAAVIVVFLIYVFAKPSTSGPVEQAATSTGAILDNLGSTSSTATPSRTRTISMKATNFSFTPNAISVNLGDTLDLRITSDGPHDFVIDEFGIKQQIPPGLTVIKFTPNKKGTYAYYCDIDGHRARGMEGTLTVK
jgi:plastocyanin